MLYFNNLIRRGNHETAFRGASIFAILVALFVGPQAGVSLAQQDTSHLAQLRIRPIGDACHLAEGPPREKDLLQYGDEIKIDNFLVEANESGLIRRVNEALDDSMMHRSRYNVTRVLAPAGYGKSTLFRYIQKRYDPQKSLIYRIPLDELKDRVAVHSLMLDELKNEAGFPMPAFAKLRAFDYDEHASPGIGFLLREFVPGSFGQKRPILIIDSIDEIHPISGTSLLKRVDDYVEMRKMAEPDGVLQVFVVGRPEGFAEYYKITQGGAPKESPVELKLPCYKTQGDFRAAARSVVKFNLFGEGSGRRDEQALTAEDRVKREEENKAKDQEIEKSVESAISLMHKYPFLCESPYNLASFGELAKVSTNYEQLNYTESQLKELFFQFLLGRNRASHNRPTLQSRDYTKLLENIAKKYEKKVDEDGYFFVTPSDFVDIEVDVDGKPHKSTYLVESALNRSGIAYLNPVNLYVAKFRFYPSWIHQHLLDRWDARNRP